MENVIRWNSVAVLGCPMLFVVSEPGLTVEKGKCGGYLDKCDTNGNRRITCAEAPKSGLETPIE